MTPPASRTRHARGFTSLLLTEGSVEEATLEFRALLTRNAESRIWQQAGSFLLSFEQYQLALEFLLRAKAEVPAANQDLAIALFFPICSFPDVPVLEWVHGDGTAPRIRRLVY